MESKEYHYARKELMTSGIDFASIPMENIIVTCGQYNGKISTENYKTVLKAIRDIYKEKPMGRYAAVPGTNKQLTKCTASRLK